MMKNVFQSLIGRLQTHGGHAIVLAQFVFQSLIGRLQTRATTRAPSSSVAFQSLIGRLQTALRAAFGDMSSASFNPS